MNNGKVEVLHHGAVKGVTGSCHELRLDGTGILIDCGLFQGTERRDDLAIDFEISHIKALVVTHVHIDHVGRIPYLLGAGFKGPIICSPPSALLLPAMLEDALKIGFTRDKKLINRVLKMLKSRLVPLPYNQWHSVANTGIEVRLQRAGHILGSAYVECEAGGQRLVFSGDLGAPHSPLLTAPVPPEQCDVLVMESTYGDKNHESRIDRRLRLKAAIEHALADGGTLLIPAFSLGRTQDLLYEIESLMAEFGNDAAAPDLPWNELEVVVDSPLAARFTGLYRKLKPFWNDEARERLSEGRHPLSFEQLTVVNSHRDHLNAVNYLARSRKPCVVLAGSGMCAGGRVVNYLKAMLGEARNDVLFVGYQAEGTPGRDILEYGPRIGSDTGSGVGWVTLDDERVTIHAQVHQVSGYSAHAGQQDLINFATGITPPPKQIRLIHGDSGAKAALKARLSELLPDSRVVIGE
ncbi:MBL fold metallo-hydrolase [Oceanisphaera arctica]|uniref:MBL fold hydrolase n=1 Tax=Oceanisphaera arctica TaxID=641510 RepID=A0A2P5TI26_9GAMM|nr:MBL fold metallo-hydrolase [Oceanisphaera arctica]PPL14275.1 MBL fold hydrolase [Oceanisphaera arctica]GHA27782.1 MBL fold hydrolase [Oceanisphaera arctica]